MPDEGVDVSHAELRPVGGGVAGVHRALSEPIPAEAQVVVRLPVVLRTSRGGRLSAHSTEDKQEAVGCLSIELRTGKRR